MSELFLSVPYVLRVLVSLGVILAVNKYSGKLALSVLCGTLLLAFWVGHPLSSALSVAGERAFSADSLFLMIVIFQVIWLSGQMAATGSMRDLVSEVRKLIPEKYSMAVLPALIGLLPMPGGAVFSAPLVDSCDEEKTVSPLLKTKINYWFRHVWD
ncbi:MAG: DUF401 family protein, partial [Fibrobacterota bacterium]